MLTMNSKTNRNVHVIIAVARVSSVAVYWTVGDAVSKVVYWAGYDELVETVSRVVYNAEFEAVSGAVKEIHPALDIDKFLKGLRS